MILHVRVRGAVANEEGLQYSSTRLAFRYCARSVRR